MSKNSRLRDRQTYRLTDKSPHYKIALVVASERRLAVWCSPKITTFNYCCRIIIVVITIVIITSSFDIPLESVASSSQAREQKLHGVANRDILCIAERRNAIEFVSLATASPTHRHAVGRLQSGMKTR